MKKKRILIIEDHDDIRESTSEILELADYEVFQASNGKQGAELAIKHLPDLVLCDIMMPGLDGYGALHLLSKREDTALIPFIFITAKTDRTDMRKGIEMGADDYLTKPFDDTELLNAIESQLKKKERQKNLYTAALSESGDYPDLSGGLDELEKIFAEGKIKTYRKKQVIYDEGDAANHAYLITEGKIKTTKMTADGKEFMTGICGPEEYFGIASLLTGSTYQETAVVMEDAKVSSVPREAISNLLKKYPDIATKFTQIFAHHVIEHEEQLLQLAYFSVRKRMAEVLLKLHSKQTGDCLDISRENLASMAGMASETVSRILSDFKEEGLIDRSAGTITLLDVLSLQKLKN
ncbi:response regulator [Chryseobacterium sp.]|uniref:response regulator n=1 Tax=Chryseobacterium sp. TaxID=1871047 RepID=UPI0011C76FCE|nr:response regulator [Chryseobacterium sp.]TXF79013.1 response regulator [Chryseobacterium sp.]